MDYEVCIPPPPHQKRRQSYFYGRCRALVAICLILTVVIGSLTVAWTRRRVLDLDSCRDMPSDVFRRFNYMVVLMEIWLILVLALAHTLQYWGIFTSRRKARMGRLTIAHFIRWMPLSFPCFIFGWMLRLSSGECCCPFLASILVGSHGLPSSGERCCPFLTSFLVGCYGLPSSGECCCPFLLHFD